MRTKDDPQIFNTRCGCGKPLDQICYHRPCNLVFCSACIKTHDCRPVNGPITIWKKPEQPALLPTAPDLLRGVLKNDTPGNGHPEKKTKRKKR